MRHLKPTVFTCGRRRDQRFGLGAAYRVKINACRYDISTLGCNECDSMGMRVLDESVIGRMRR